MKVKVKSLSRLFVTPWTVVYQASPSMGFSRQEYWSGLPFPSPGDLPSPGIKPRSPALQEDSLPTEPPGKPKNTGVGSISTTGEVATLSPGDLPDLGIKPKSPALQTDSLPAELPGKISVQFSSVQSLSRVRLFATP